FAAMAESPEFTGKVIDALYTDEALMDKTGQALISAEVALNLGVTDINGKQPASHRDMLGGPLQFNSAVVE
ncbi:MAG: short-chain dehydrogenase, partial [Ketobacteraceae bacterium]|nr:short-chain dehydrogenase [Ketobacteraceae bacterium]